MEAIACTRTSQQIKKSLCSYLAEAIFIFYSTLLRLAAIAIRGNQPNLRKKSAKSLRRVAVLESGA
jgi:hypothetical protein